MFLLNQEIVSPFVHIFHIISIIAAEFEEPKTGISGRVKFSPSIKIFTKRQNFGLVKMQGICRQQIILAQNLKFVLGRVDNIVGKGENAAFSPFPPMLSMGGSRRGGGNPEPTPHPPPPPHPLEFWQKCAYRIREMVLV